MDSNPLILVLSKLLNESHFVLFRHRFSSRFPVLGYTYYATRVNGQALTLDSFNPDRIKIVSNVTLQIVRLDAMRADSYGARAEARLKSLQSISYSSRLLS